MRVRPASMALAAAASLVVLASGPRAEEVRTGPPPSCSCTGPGHAPKASPRPRYADHSRDLDGSDEIAALDAIRMALTQVGDGSSFVWHRHNGRLSGVVQPTHSFKDVSGRVCRHIVVILTTGVRTGRIEGIACRLADGGWQLEG